MSCSLGDPLANILWFVKRTGLPNHGEDFTYRKPFRKTLKVWKARFQNITAQFHEWPLSKLQVKLIHHKLHLGVNVCIWGWVSLHWKNLENFLGNYQLNFKLHILPYPHHSCWSVRPVICDYNSSSLKNILSEIPWSFLSSPQTSISGEHFMTILVLLCLHTSSLILTLYCNKGAIFQGQANITNATKIKTVSVCCTLGQYCDQLGLFIYLVTMPVSFDPWKVLCSYTMCILLGPSTFRWHYFFDFDTLEDLVRDKAFYKHILWCWALIWDIF